MSEYVKTDDGVQEVIKKTYTVDDIARKIDDTAMEIEMLKEQLNGALKRMQKLQDMVSVLKDEKNG